MDLFTSDNTPDPVRTGQLPWKHSRGNNGTWCGWLHTPDARSVIGSVPEGSFPGGMPAHLLPWTPGRHGLWSFKATLGCIDCVGAGGGVKPMR